MPYEFKHTKRDVAPVPAISAVRRTNTHDRTRAVPSDAQIRREHAETPAAGDLAQRWGVTTSCVYQHLRRLNLRAPAVARPDAAPAAAAPVAVEPKATVDAPVAPAPMPAAPVSATNVVAFEAPWIVSEAGDPEPAPQRVVIHARPPEPVARAAPRTVGRLGVEDLALAYGLACRAGNPPEEAIRFVRADVAAEADSPGVFA